MRFNAVTPNEENDGEREEARRRLDALKKAAGTLAARFGYPRGEGKRPKGRVVVRKRGAEFSATPQASTVRGRYIRSSPWFTCDIPRYGATREAAVESVVRALLAKLTERAGADEQAVSEAIACVRGIVDTDRSGRPFFPLEYP